MSRIVPITPDRYIAKRWTQPPSFAFVASQSVVPIVGAEFGKAGLAMPIAFIEQTGIEQTGIEQTGIEQTGQYVPVAVLSLIAGRNMFVGPAGQWLGRYVPAALRCYPFRLGRADSSDKLMLCIDEESGLVGDADSAGELFFTEDGAPAEATKRVLDFLLALEGARAATALSVGALAEARVIEPWPLQIKTDERTMPVGGLFRVSEAALVALDDEAFLKLRRAGALPLAYLQLHSMAQLGVFARLAQIQRQPAPPQPASRERRPIESLDEIFGMAAGETLKFD